jgi:phosphoserine phosphatase RsbU/P
MHKEKILVVEDEKIIILVIQAALKRYYTVLTASDGQEGLEMAVKEQPDLIISDVMMPKMDGFTLREKLREIRELNLVPFIFLTSMDSQDAREQGLRRGADDFLTKPFEPDILLKRVHTLLARSRVYREESIQQFNEQVSRALFQPPPEVPGYQISYTIKPANIGGGDIINYIHHGHQAYTFLFGDVMGKGTNAKFFAYSFIGYLRGLLVPTITSRQSATPARMMDQLSRLLEIDPFLQDIFISLMTAHFDFYREVLIYSNAGYMPSFFYQRATGQLRSLNCGGGIPGFSQLAYEEETLPLAEGDAMIVVSDGVLEAKNEQMETLGDEMIQNWIRELVDLPAEDMVSRLLMKTEGYMNHTLQYDDISIVVIKKTKEA